METIWNAGLTNGMPGSYRTYEEWKLDYRLFEQYSKSFVLTVPMRNGNASNEQFVTDFTNVVLTVPMRNGNFFTIFHYFELFYFVLTVPMRNGN